MDKITATDKVEAVTKYNTMPEDTMGIGGYYTAVCYSADGFVKWTDEIDNIVTTVGRNFTLDTTLGNTAGGAVVMGLKGTGTAVAADSENRVSLRSSGRYHRLQLVPTGNWSNAVAIDVDVTGQGAR
jgi:hypothetical protein